MLYSKSQYEWARKYEEKQALWIHDGDMRRRHVLLTSGKHSNGYFNSPLVIDDGVLLREAVADIVTILPTFPSVIEDVDCVVGPQTKATKLARFISEEIGKRRGRYCRWASLVKSGEGVDRKMIFDDITQSVLAHERVLRCDDVITTGGSVQLMTEAVIKAGAHVLPCVVALVNRFSPKLNGTSITALLARHMPIWEPEECPLCKEGSEAVRPKENWALLNAEY